MFLVLVELHSATHEKYSNLNLYFLLFKNKTKCKQLLFQSSFLFIFSVSNFIYIFELAEINIFKLLNFMIVNDGRLIVLQGDINKSNFGLKCIYQAQKNLKYFISINSILYIAAVCRFVCIQETLNRTQILSRAKKCQPIRSSRLADYRENTNVLFYYIDICLES